MPQNPSCYEEPEQLKAAYRRSVEEHLTTVHCGLSSPVEFTLSTVRNLLRQKEAWDVAGLEKQLAEAFKRPHLQATLFTSSIGGD